jgi:hypothetical protein
MPWKHCRCPENTIDKVFVTIAWDNEKGLHTIMKLTTSTIILKSVLYYRRTSTSWIQRLLLKGSKWATIYRVGYTSQKALPTPTPPTFLHIWVGMESYMEHTNSPPNSRWLDFTLWITLLYVQITHRNAMHALRQWWD